ncbi:hypothetical protein CDCE8392_1771 [Corynebacterium diphtheriae CDCE 8392]|nr:hypothetical protein CDCE8392_1771 [Corynebacterium diphtheriae CDCE 8392]
MAADATPCFPTYVLVPLGGILVDISESIRCNCGEALFPGQCIGGV